MWYLEKMDFRCHFFIQTIWEDRMLARCIVDEAVFMFWVFVSIKVITVSWSMSMGVKTKIWNKIINEDVRLGQRVTYTRLNRSDQQSEL